MARRDVLELTGDPGLRVRVTGLRQTARALERAGIDAADLKGTMRALGGMVVAAAAPAAPRRTGRLAASIRTGGGKTKAVVRAGGARVPYAGVQHYGWPARGITGRPFLADAVRRTRPALLRKLDTDLGALLKRADLK